MDKKVIIVGGENLQFGEELVKILDIYTENGFSNGEPLDSDEVESLTHLLKAQLELLNGNITEEEYNNMLEPKLYPTPTKKSYLLGTNRPYVFGVLFSDENTVNRIFDLTEKAKLVNQKLLVSDIAVSFFFVSVNDGYYINKTEDFLECFYGKYEKQLDLGEIIEAEIPTDFIDELENSVPFRYEIVITENGFYFKEEDNGEIETTMIDLFDITE